MPEPSDATRPSDLAARRAMFIMFLVVVVDLLGFGIVLPLLPRYAEGYIPAATSPAKRGLIIGALMSSFSAMQFLFAPVWGRVSDRVGRRPVLLVGLAGSVVSYLLFGFASDLDPERWRLWLTLILVSRLGAGVAGATISTAAAVIADCTSRENRARGMALIGAAFGLGFTVGPLIAYAGEKLIHARSGPGYLAAGLSFAALVLGLLVLPETSPGLAEARASRTGRLSGLAGVLRSPTVGLLVVSLFLAVFAFANLEGTLSLLNSAAFGLQDDANYLLFAYVGASLMVAQGVIYRRLIGRFGELRMTRAGLVLMLLGLANLAGVAAVAEPQAAGILAWFMAALFVAVCGFAFLNPSINALISKRTDPARQGEVLGAAQSASALARILGPAAGNLLFPLTSRHELPYVTAAALLLVVLALSPRLGGDGVQVLR